MRLATSKCNTNQFMKLNKKDNKIESVPFFHIKTVVKIHLASIKSYQHDVLGLFRA